MVVVVLLGNLMETCAAHNNHSIPGVFGQTLGQRKPWQAEFLLGLGYELRDEKKKAIELYERSLGMMRWKYFPDWYYATHALERLRE